MDPSRLFSLVCLLNQCVLAWVFVGFFGALTRGSARWLRSFLAAFVGLGVGLTAIVLRFLLHELPGMSGPPVADGALAVRALYGVYLAGKLLFLAGLVRGVLRWRGKPAGAPAWVVGVTVVTGLVLGFAVPTIETVLLVQGPVAVVACAFAAWQLRADGRDGLPDAGRPTVRVALLLMAVAWSLYIVATLFAGLETPRETTPFAVLLRYNSLFDLALQVVLATGLIVAVLSDSHGRTLAAQAERDRLRSLVLRDDKLRVTATLVSGVAHEINNPLTAIAGYVDDLSSDDPAVRARAALVVREQAERCRSIVQRMSVIGRRRLLSTSTFRVRDAVDSVVAGFAPRCAKDGVRIDVEVPAALEAVADVTGFEQVLTNLLANALDVTASGSAIEVRARVDDGGVRLTVRDRGPGVSGPDRARVFEPFWTTKRAWQGSGLGLAVVDAIVRLHGGSIEVRDGDGGGAEFVVRWPDRSPSETGAAAPGQQADATPKVAGSMGRMMVIDDEPLVRSTIRRCAEVHGWIVDETDSASVGYEQLMSDPGRFRAVICDMRLPGMTGTEFHDALEANAPDVLARTLFVTGDLASQEMASFSERCRGQIVTKPFVARELVQRLANLVAR